MDLACVRYTEAGKLGPKIPQLQMIRRMLRRLLAAQELPANPLDEFIDLMGGEDKVRPSQLER